MGMDSKFFCRNTLMQGKAASADVCQAMDELRQIKSLDAIVITRGGGSIADLSCFDSQAIAEKSLVPVCLFLAGLVMKLISRLQI